MVVDKVVVIVAMIIVIIVDVGTNYGIKFFAEFAVSANVGKIRVMLNREHSGR
jgi:hypothetical protein